MTLAIKQHKENGYYVIMEWDKTNIYRVAVCPCYDENRCGYPEREMIYSLNEKNNAIATYNRYVRKYCKGKN